MGVLWRKRSLLLKLLVVVGTAWFTVAFLIFTDSGRTPNRMDLSIEESEMRHKPANNIVAERRVAERVVPFRDLPTTKRDEPIKKGIDNNVLLPPQSMAGELGKPVVLPSNLSGKLIEHFKNFLRKIVNYLLISLITVIRKIPKL